MKTIAKFEDIEAWQRGRALTKRIYQVSSQKDFARDFGLRDQIRRAAVSVMSNIAEGYERDGNKEFLQFLSLAKGSVGEVKAQLYVALDTGFISQQEFHEIYELATQTGQLVGGFMRYIVQSDLRGAKYR